jgi:hypothetical protein
MTARQLPGDFSAYAVRRAGNDDVGHLQAPPYLVGQHLLKRRLQIQKENRQQNH